MLSSELAFRVVGTILFMRSPHRCKCDECRSVEMVLHELDHIAPVKVATREREILSAIVE